MKVIYIHQYFSTPQGTGGGRSYDVSKYMVENGHQVTVVCGLSDNAPYKTVPWYLPFKSQWIDGIKLVVCNVKYANAMSVPRRMWAFFGFAMLATFACLWERGADLVFASSTPLTVGIPGRLAAMFKRVPFIFEVRDLWPEDLLAAGRMKKGMAYKFWEWLERFSYARACKIVLVSKGFHDRLLERGFEPDRLCTLVLGAPGDLFADAQPDHEYMEKHGLKDKTVAIFTGAHGDANGLFQVLDAAELLLDRPDIAIVMIGHGGTKPRLKADVEKRGLHNVHMLDSVPKTQLVNILAASHIGLMILKQIVRPRWVTPNKLFDYMFTGIPQIVNFPGTTAELVEAEGVGVASKPGDAQDLADKIRYYADHPEEREAVGKRAREVAYRKYDRRILARQFEELFQNCLPPAKSVNSQAEARTAK